LIAIFRQGNKRLIGYKEDVTEEEIETYDLDFLLGETLPEGIKTIPAGHYAVVEDDFTISYESFEVVPPTPEQIRIAQLEQQLAQTNQDLAAVLEMILG
jgi:hypothetical protein